MATPRLTRGKPMARVSRGVAAYCSTDDIGQLVFQSFLGGRHTKRYTH